MSTMARSIRLGLWEATRNALKVLYAGVVAFALYLGLVTFGPGIEGKFFPVLTDYRLANIRSVQGGGFSFRSTFNKVRDCTYYGVTWFAQDERGNLTRVQLGRTDEPGPPATGPVGARTGDRVTLYPPHGTTAIFGLNHHECGPPWQTRTMVGPFMLDGDGRPEASSSPVRWAFSRPRR